MVMATAGSAGCWGVAEGTPDVPVFVKDDVRVLFVHVPKTGGSAIEDAFRDDGWDVHFLDRTSRRNPVSRLRRCSPQHMHAALLEEVLRVGDMTATVMVVREPLARFRSEYLWRHRSAPELDAATVEDWGRRLLGRYADDPYLRDNHVRPQAEFLLPGAGVHRYEDGLQAAVDDVARQVGQPPPTVPGPPVADGPSSSDVVLTPALESELRDFYAADFETFGYGAVGGAGLSPG